MALWKNDAMRAKAQKLFDYIHSFHSRNNGWPVNFDLSLAIREFCYLSSNDKLRSLADDTLLGLPTRFAQIKSRDVTTLEKFEQAFEHHVSSLGTPKESHLWKFYLPFYMAPKEGAPQLPHIHILDIDFDFQSLSSVLEQVSRSKFERRATKEHFAGLELTVEPPQLYLVVSSNGASWKTAWQQVEPAFDTLRGIVELTVGLGTVHYDSHQQPRRKIPYPAWLVAQRPGEQDTFEQVDFLVDPYRKGKLLEFTEDFISCLKENSKFFKTTPEEESTMGLIANCHRLYAQALDARLPHHCLVGLWQLAELITLADDSNGYTDVVVKRLVWHTSEVGGKGVEYREILNSLAIKRNQVVHKGIHNVSHDDVNVLKIICEKAILWLLRVHTTLPTIQHVREFYTLRTVNNADLEKAITRGGIVEEVARYVKSQQRR